ncbi:hypothetical protein PG984_002924 [Apiospora sp. TS-2023a]
MGKRDKFKKAFGLPTRSKPESTESHASSSTLPKTREDPGTGVSNAGPSSSSGVRAPQTIEANAVSDSTSPLPQRDHLILDRDRNEDDEQGGVVEAAPPKGTVLDAAGPSQDGRADINRDARMKQLYPGGDTRGLRFIHRPVESKLWIIFIHGLTGDSFRTWYHPNGTFWPKDILPQSLPHATILTFGYDADVARFLGDVGQGTLHSHAMTFVSDVGTKLSMEDVGDDTRLFIVAHSLGGLVAKKAICISSEAYDQTHQVLHKHMAGFFFLGTPHQGSGQADLATVMLRIVDVATLGWKRTNKRIVKVLQPSSEILDDLQWSFSQWIRNSSRVSVRCFFEEKAMAQGMVVPIASARIDGYSCLPIPQNHSEMTKFSSVTDVGYERVSGQLQLRCRELSRPGLPQTIPASTDATYSSQTDESERVQDEKKMLREYASALEFPDMRFRLERIKKPTKATCEWLCEHPVFTSWMQDRRGIIWLLGHPGTGKSTLVKYALSSRARNGGEPTPVTISFFFDNSGGTRLQHSVEGLLRSLLCQLVEHCPDLLQGFGWNHTKLPGYSDSRGASNGGLWPVDLLMAHFEKALLQITQSRPVQIFVDALDECRADMANADHETDEIREFVREISRILEDLLDQPYGVALCLSCRHYPRVAGSGADNQIVTEDENSNDIKKYLYSELTRGISKEDEAMVDPLAKSIADRAHGSFQWVRLVTSRALRHYGEVHNLQKIKEKIEELPTTLSKLYEQITLNLRRERCDQSLKLFQWLCFAKRPLTVDEIRAAMAIVPDPKYVMAKDLMSTEFYVENTSQMKRLIPIISGGLAGISYTYRHQDDGSGSVLFIHQSVKDYLIEAGLKQLCPSLSSTQDVICAGHRLLMASCIWALTSGDIKQKESAEPLPVPPELMHAYFGILPMGCFEERQLLEMIQTSPVPFGKGKVQSLAFSRTELDRLYPLCIENLASDDARYKGRLPVWEVPTDKVGQDRDSDLLKPQRQDLNRALRLMVWVSYITGNLPNEKDSVTMLTKDSLVNPVMGYCLDSWHYHAQRSCESGSIELIREPLGWFFSRTGVGWLKFLECCGFLLHSAAKAGSHETVKVLLEQDTQQHLNINALDGDGDMNTALGLATEGGHLEVVSLLLQQESLLVDLVNSEGQSPLLLAALNGYDAILDLLISRGADIFLRDNSGCTALVHACYRDSIKTIEILCGHGARLDPTKEEDIRAFDRMDLDVQLPTIRLLLQQSAAKERQSLITPHKLMLTRCHIQDRESTDTLRYLIQTKTNIDPVTANWSSLPLDESSLFAILGYDDVPALQLLLESHSASIDTLKPEYNVLNMAVVFCAEECLVWLVKDYGWDVSIEDRMGETPFHVAINGSIPYTWKYSRRYEAIARQLLALDGSRVDMTINKPDRQHKTPLMAAAEGNVPNIVDMILKGGRADVNAQTEAGTALWLAIKSGSYINMWTLLKNPRIDPNLGLKDGTTPLHVAAIFGDAEPIKRLLNHTKIDTGKKDMHGLTAIQRARNHQVQPDVLAADWPPPSLQDSVSLQEIEQLLEQHDDSRKTSHAELVNAGEIQSNQKD